jgi:ribonuclease P protein component
LFLLNILSNPQRVPHQQKLTQAKEFQLMLKAPCRISSDSFLLRAGENGLSGARLGLIASRKAARRAVDRNRAKRLAREVFRSARAQLPPIDLVLQLKYDLRDIGNAPLRMDLARLMRRAGARFAVESSSQTPARGTGQ